MKHKADVVPTKGEFEILQVLWKLGSVTVKQVHLEIGRNGAYTTTLKLLQIMTEKGLVERKEAGRAHVYTAKISEKQGTGEFIRELVKRVFGGSPTRLVMQVLGSGKPTRSELGKIRRLIEEMEGGKE
jgi:predicted transcriptional regulator